MNSNVITADIPLTADTGAQTIPATTVQSALVYIAKQSLETNNVSQTSNQVDVKSVL